MDFLYDRLPPGIYCLKDIIQYHKYKAHTRHFLPEVNILLNTKEYYYMESEDEKES